MIPERDIDEAIKRLGLSHDGRLLYRRLQTILMSVCPANQLGALPLYEGRRSLARELKALMDEGLAQGHSGDGPTSSGPGNEHTSSGHDPDVPAVVEPRRPVDNRSGRGTERRVTPYSNEPQT